MRLKAKKDGNQTEVVNTLRKYPGVTVAVTSQLGKGFCDIIVGFRNKNYLIELKDGSKPPSARKLTPDEIRFRDCWTGHYAVCKNIDEVLKEIGIN
jgi:hypothetical protein